MHLSFEAYLRGIETPGEVRRRVCNQVWSLPKRDWDFETDNNAEYSIKWFEAYLRGIETEIPRLFILAAKPFEAYLRGIETHYIRTHAQRTLFRLKPT